MIRRIKRYCFLAGLVMLGASSVGGRQAQAKGVVITSGHTQQIGDPLYDYIFDLRLNPGTTLLNGGYLTLYDVPAITSSSDTGAPNSFWGYSIQTTGITPPIFQPPLTPPPDNSLENITWVYHGPSISNNSTTQDLEIGLFRVQTIELSAPPSPTLIYVGTLDGTTATTEGTVTVNAVPEPSSLILLLIGAGTLPLYAFRNLRHRLRPRPDSPRSRQVPGCETSDTNQEARAFISPQIGPIPLPLVSRCGERFTGSRGG